VIKRSIVGENEEGSDDDGFEGQKFQVEVHVALLKVGHKLDGGQVSPD
jgi:hypothetical protein